MSDLPESPMRPAVSLPRWLGGAEFSEVSQLAERWWTLVQSQLEKAVVLQDALNCPESALYLHAWQWGITRFPQEPLDLFRKRIYYAPINNLDAGSTQGLKNIFERLELGAVEIYERIEGYDWDEVIVRVSNRQLAESELIRFIVSTYGLSARRYYIEVLDQVDLYLPAFSAECDYRCYAPDKGFVPLPPYEPEPEPLDSDALAAAALQSSALSSEQLAKLSAAIKCLKGDNALSVVVWDDLDCLSFTRFVRDKELALTCLKRKIKMTAHGVVNYTQVGGLVSGGGVVDTHWTPLAEEENYTAGDGSSGVIVAADIEPESLFGTKYFFGTYLGNRLLLRAAVNSGGLYAGGHINTSSSTVTNTETEIAEGDLFAIERHTGSARQHCYKNGAELTSISGAVVSTAFTASLLLFTQRTTEVVPTTGGSQNLPVGCWYAGAALTANQRAVLKQALALLQ